MFFRVFLIALLAASSVRAQSDDALQFDVLDLTPLVTPVVDAPIEPWFLPLRSAYHHAHEVDFSQSGLAPTSVGVEDVVNLVRSAVRPEEWDRDGARLWLLESGERLGIVQTEAVLERVRSRVAELARVMRRKVGIDVLFVKGSASSLAALIANGTVSSQKFDEIRAGESELDVLGVATRLAVSGQRIRVQDGESVHVLGEASVEVAQTASIGDLRVQRIKMGVDLSVRPTMMVDGRINLRLQFDSVRDLEIDSFDVRSSAVGVVELPSVTVRKVTASGAVRPGEALVVGAIDGGRGDAIVAIVRARGDVTPVASLQSDATTRGYPTAFLAQPDLTTPRLTLGWANGSERMHDSVSREDELFVDESSFMYRDEIIDVIRKATPDAPWSSGDARIDTAGGWLWVSAPRAHHQGIRAVVERLNERRGAFGIFEIQIVDVATATVENLRRTAGDGWLRQILRSNETFRRHTLVSSGELGGRIEFASGRESTFVSDFDPEIAQGAQVSEPRVEGVFDGVYLRLAPRRGPGRNEFLLFYELELSRFPGPHRVVEPDPSLGFGRVQLPRIAMSSCAGEAPARAGAYALLTSIPRVDSPDLSTLVIVRVRQ